MENDIYNLFINQHCKIILEINGYPYTYSAYVLDYNSETITFIDKYKKPYTYASKFITELKLQKETQEEERAEWKKILENKNNGGGGE
jgi:hypothetical protein